jgi:large-conductance mechanosensitive channel
MLREFRDFLLRGNIVELAIAFVLGVAFGALITS